MTTAVGGGLRKLTVSVEASMTAPFFEYLGKNGVRNLSQLTEKTELLKRYDRLIRDVMPDCSPFFPNVLGEYHSSYWLRINFRPLW